jgi:predicted nucleic acid-binding protein
MSKQVIDACCLINFYGSGSCQEMLKSVGGFLIPEYVQQEALKVRVPSLDDPSTLVVTEIDLTREINEGLLIKCVLEGEPEREDFVQFASELDDGEAACLAIAKHRNLIVATDDRKAIRIATEANIETITTPKMLKHWIESGSIDQEIASQVLTNIEQRAKFRLKASSEYYDWWQRTKADA